MVDTDGRGLKLQVHPASIQDRDGAIPLLRASRAWYPVECAAEQRMAERANATSIIVEIVRKLPGQVGFGSPPRRCGRALLRMARAQSPSGKIPRLPSPRLPLSPVCRIRHAAQ